MAFPNQGTAKTVRKALRDLGQSNGDSRFSVAAKKKISKMEEVEAGDGSLDSLLLLHSDLSSVIHQVDELVARAFQVMTTSKHGRSAIESFKQVLSDILSSLKPWVSRFDEALASCPLGLENQSVESPSNKNTCTANRELSADVGSPEETKLESLISPSPLVSWRADCTIKRGRQLFVLTPMPMAKGLLSSRHQEPTKSIFERVTYDNTFPLLSLFSISGDSNDDLLEAVVNPMPRKASDLAVTETESSQELPSPAMFSKTDGSSLVMTPRLKMSPPKSCVVLEPISESSHHEDIRARKSTPFPARTTDNNDSSESSRKEASERLTMKYPELLGIQQAYKMGPKKKALEESWDWFMSPPKSCILMEPPDEKSFKTDLNLPDNDLHQQTMASSPKETDVWGNCHQTQKSCHQAFALESTPMWKQPESTIRTGKAAGENTLKKELWTRFEAATTNKLSVNASVLPTTATHKGFLDLLEEVSCDETSPFSESLR